MKRGPVGEMLRTQKKHISFHTPGHKRAGDDITELSYSDNLCSPHGAIAKSQRMAADICGAEATFYLTDGSTCGVHAMLYALKKRGVKKIACPLFSHKSVTVGMEILGLTPVYFPLRTEYGIPQQPTKEEMQNALSEADALLLVSPDYYGFFPDLKAARELCDRQKKPLVIDGAHGSHLRGTDRYAGKYADMWVDGLHKSLPALTQGAAVSSNNGWAEVLNEGVRAFHTSSPSYPILKSVEEAFLSSRNEKTERLAEETKRRVGAVLNEDWTKILIAFGGEADGAQAFLEAHGVFPEFNDGNYLMFYCSPCTRAAELKKLGRLLKNLPRGEVKDVSSEAGTVGLTWEWVPLKEAVGRTAAADAGLFPPCVPLVRRGEIIKQEHAERLQKAANTFGLNGDKISVYRRTVTSSNKF